jgi:hypothetical protein
VVVVGNPLTPAVTATVMFTCTVLSCFIALEVLMITCPALKLLELFDPQALINSKMATIARNAGIERRMGKNLLCY